MRKFLNYSRAFLEPRYLYRLTRKVVNRITVLHSIASRGNCAWDASRGKCDHSIEWHQWRCGLCASGCKLYCTYERWRRCYYELHGRGLARWYWLCDDNEFDNRQRYLADVSEPVTPGYDVHLFG